MKIFLENAYMVNNTQKYLGTLHENLSMFHCCWRH